MSAKADFHNGRVKYLQIVTSTMKRITNKPTSYPGSFHYAPRWRKDPGPGWSRVSQILGDNNWDL